MKVIPAKIPNKRASMPCYVDDEDYDMLARCKWHTTHGYAMTNVRISNPKHKSKRCHASMHQVILWCPKGYEIDHKDGKRNNNQKSNLRICTRSQNQFNVRLQRNNTSGFKGVSYRKSIGKYRARIMKNFKMYELGEFVIAAEAHDVYKKASKKLHGEFGRIK